MTKPYLVPLTEIRREHVVVNSRFIATLAPAFSIDEVRAFRPERSRIVPIKAGKLDGWLVAVGALVLALILFLP